MNVCNDLSIMAMYAGRVSLALGIFDGVHLGHRKILKELRRLAMRTNSSPVVFSFFPHPKEVLTGKAPLQIYDLNRWSSALYAEEMAGVVLQPFTERLAHLSPLNFLNAYFRGKVPRVCGICVGRNFRFGAENAGSTSDLEKWCRSHGIECSVVPEELYNGEVISSSRIREAIQAGNMEDARAMLAVPYCLKGEVVHGQGIGGKELGYPTANLKIKKQLLPPSGVYAAQCSINGGKPVQGIFYIGDAPTFRTDGKRQFEFYAFDFDGDLYGHQLEVAMFHFIRGSHRFESRQELVQQIDQDIHAAREILSTL